MRAASNQQNRSCAFDMFCLGLIGWAFNGLFFLAPLVALPLALGFSFYLMIRLSLAFVLFHLVTIAMKKFVPTLFTNLVLHFLAHPPPHGQNRKLISLHLFSFSDSLPTLCKRSCCWVLACSYSPTCPSRWRLPTALSSPGLVCDPALGEEAPAGLGS